MRNDWWHWYLVTVRLLTKSNGCIGQLAYGEHAGLIFFMLLKLLKPKYVSNKAVGKFFNVLEYSKSINWHFFDAAVNNLNSK